LTVVDALKKHLAAWDFDGHVQTIEEISPAGKAGRAFLVRSAVGNPYVAKLAYDSLRVIMPGLSIAERLATYGIPTGPPRRTKSGDLAVAWPAGDSEWTLAVLQFEPGDPIDLAEVTTPGRLGRFLAEVHTALLALTKPDDVPERLLDWWQSHARATGSAQAFDVLRQLDPVAGRLPQSVIYGDPSPEVLNHDGWLALIDWGTPSWGPQVHDVACWIRYLRQSGAGELRIRAFLAAYSSLKPLTAEEDKVLPIWDSLVATIRP
jgi:Ser/Thr protein kinase RdoA (MazF antagonist)